MTKPQRPTTLPPARAHKRVSRLRDRAQRLLALTALGVLAAPLAWGADAGAPVARGLIVTLKPLAQGGREQPQAARQRLASVAREAGVPWRGEVKPLGVAHQRIEFPAPLQGPALDDALRRMRLNPSVASVEADVRLRRQIEPNDPDYTSGLQWFLRTPAAGGSSAINMPPAWDRNLGSDGVVVAVMDTGVRYDHPDLQARLLPGYDFVSDVTTANDGNGRDADASDPGDWISSDDQKNPAFSDCVVEDSSWHGTFIAGLIGAATHNGQGVAGVTVRGPILPVRVAGKCGGYLSDAVDGLRWAAGLHVEGVPDNPRPARVINYSFGGGPVCSPVFQMAIDDALRAGSLFVVAGGNESGLASQPANCRDVLTVAAVNQDGSKAWYSNYGASISLAAPGGSAGQGGPALYSTSDSGSQGPQQPTYAGASGTSFAAPLAAGVAALMLAVNPQLSPNELIERLRASARPHVQRDHLPTCQANADSISEPCNCTTASCGVGLLDADRALQAAVGGGTGPGGTVSGGGSGGTGGTGGGGSDPGQGGSGGGGGATGLWAGLGLWLLAGGLAWRQRRS